MFSKYCQVIPLRNLVHISAHIFAKLHNQHTWRYLYYATFGRNSQSKLQENKRKSPSKKDGPEN